MNLQSFLHAFHEDYREEIYTKPLLTASHLGHFDPLGKISEISIEEMLSGRVPLII
jgi:hypothetical protein